MGEDALEVLLVLLSSTSVSNTGSVDQVDQTFLVWELVGHWRLSSGLTSGELLGVALLSNLDLHSLALIVSEGEAGGDDGQEIPMLGGGFQVFKVDVVGEPIDPGRFAHTSLSQNQNVDFFRLRGIFNKIYLFFNCLKINFGD